MDGAAGKWGWGGQKGAGRATEGAEWHQQGQILVDAMPASSPDEDTKQGHWVPGRNPANSVLHRLCETEGCS